MCIFFSVQTRTSLKEIFRISVIYINICEIANALLMNSNYSEFQRMYRMSL